MPATATRGHPAASAAIGRAVRSERPPQAILLVGPDRVGKVTLALDLARGLLCRAADPSERPCGVCAACRKALHGNHPDLHRVAPEGPGDQVRLGHVQALLGELALMPMEGRFRVAIVEDAHRLNPDAQNALLKTLEEPHPGTVICLCVDDESLILPTVVSRCARYRLGSVASEAIVELLGERGVSDSVLAARLARVSGGRPGLAIALAAAPEAVLARDRLIRHLLDLTAADRRSRLGAVAELMADGATLRAVVSGGSTRSDDDQGAPIARQPKPRKASGSARGKLSPAERRTAAAGVLEAWRGLARDMLLAGEGGDRLVHHTELLEELRAAAAGVARGELVTFLGELDRLSAAVDGYASPELVMDVLVMRWPSRSQAA